MITLSIVFLVMVIITLGILWMLERPRARLQVGDSDSSEAPVSMDDVLLDLDIASTYYAKGLLAKGLVPSFEYYTIDELARMYGITQEEVERRRKKLQERIPWIGEAIG